MFYEMRSCAAELKKVSIALHTAPRVKGSSIDRSLIHPTSMNGYFQRAKLMASELLASCGFSASPIKGRAGRWRRGDDVDAIDRMLGTRPGTSLCC